MTKPITIAIAEDHEFVRKGFISLLEDYDQIKIIFEAESGTQLLKRLKRIRPDIILLDIDMPEMNGLEVLKEAKQLYPEINIMMVSAHYKKPFILEAILHGAKAFLPKNCKVDKVINAIETVYIKGEYFSKDIVAMMEGRRKKTVTSLKILNELEQHLEKKGKSVNFKNELTARELVIIKLILDKKTNKEIAEILNLHEKTIEANRAKIYRKTNTEGTLDLMRFAVKNKIIDGI